MRSGRGLLVAILLLAVAGTALLLLAFDIRAWQHTVAGDDVRFAAGPRSSVRWQAATTLPGDPAGGLLGISSSVRYRRAAQLFRTVTKGANSNGEGDDSAAAVTSADAQTALAAVVDGSAADAERSRAANLLGVLVVTSPSPTTRRTQLQLLEHAAGYFRRAIELAPSNYEAKLNLELVLRLQEPGTSRLDHDARGGYGFGRGHGVDVTGSGY